MTIDDVKHICTEITQQYLTIFNYISKKDAFQFKSKHLATYVK